MIQLGLFTENAPVWENITNDWLLEYLQQAHPELKFQALDGWIKQTAFKKLTLAFSVVRRTPGDNIWCRKKDMYISVSYCKNYGNYEGIYTSAEDFDKFVRELKRGVQKLKEWKDENKQLEA